MSRRFRPLICGFISALFAASEGHAQLVLPGAAPAAPQGAATAPAKPKHAGASPQGAGASAKSAKAPAAPSVAGLVGRPLLLNGKSGLLQISGDDKMVTIDKLQLAGEGVSDPSQRCVVDIVGEKPIEATNVGRPDGLERFEADIPACPISFDILDGAALVPSQITACVFKAADCQTSPGGLWGPDGSSLVGDAADKRQGARPGRKGDGQGLASDPSPRRGQPAGGQSRARSDRLRRPARRRLPGLPQGERPWLLRLAPDRGADRAPGDAARRVPRRRRAKAQSDKGKKTKPRKGAQQP